MRVAAEFILQAHCFRIFYISLNILLIMAVDTESDKKHKWKKEISKKKKESDTKVGSKELKEAERHVKQIG